MIPGKKQSYTHQVMPIPRHMKQTASNGNLEHHLITEAHFKGPEHQLTEERTSLNAFCF